MTTRSWRFSRPYRNDTPATQHQGDRTLFQSRVDEESPAAQQNYISSNYTHIVRDMARCLGINVMVQMVAARDTDGGPVTQSVLQSGYRDRLMQM